MYVGGEIADLAAIGRPSIGVVTAVQAVHLSRIGSLEAIERAKGELLEALPPDGTAILNADDPIVPPDGPPDGRPGAALRVRRDADVGPSSSPRSDSTGCASDCARRPARRPRTIPTLGRLSVHNALAAAAVGLVAGCPSTRSSAACVAAGPRRIAVEVARLRGVTRHRRHVQRLTRSVRAALDLLAGLPGRRSRCWGDARAR